MTERCFHVSKFVVILGPVLVLTITVAALFVGRVAYVLGVQYDASLSLLVWTIWAFFTVACIWSWAAVVRLVRNRAEPIIAFKVGSVKYKTTAGEIVSVPLSEIQGIEIEKLGPKYGGGHILISRANAKTDKVFISNLGASSNEVFAAFKERLPRLLQPYRTIQRLTQAA